MWFIFRNIVPFANYAGAMAASMLLFACNATAIADDTTAEKSTSACDSLAAKYPFARTSTTDASLTEIENYLKKALLDTQSHPPTTPQQAPASQHVQWVAALQQAIFQSDWTTRNRTISLRLESISQNLGSATVFSDGKPILRSYGPRIPYQSNWPTQLQALSIQAADVSDSVAIKVEVSGLWALLRLVDTASGYQIVEDQVRLTVKGANHTLITLSIAGVNDLLSLRETLSCPRDQKDL